LREEIEQISEELKREKEQRVLEVEKSEFLESRLATLESENATQQSEIEALSQSKVSEIEKLRCQMSSELQRTQERLEMLTEKNEFLMSKVSNLELDKESREVELKNLETSCRQNERDIQKLSSEITGEMERFNLKVAENETLSQKLSEAEKEIEQQKRCISELSRNFDADAEKCAKLMVHEKELLSEIASEKERYSLQVAENETLNKKLSEAVKEIEQQTQSIAKLSQNCVADAEKYAESLAREKEVCNSEVEKNWALTEKVSTLQNQILAQEMTLKEQSELMQAQVVQFEQVCIVINAYH
jgi:chromosome segregation ATPase